MLNVSTLMSHTHRLPMHSGHHFFPSSSSPTRNPMSLPFLISPSSAPYRVSSSPSPPPKKTLSKPRLNASSSLPAKKVRSSKSNIPGTSRYWTPSEHRLFVDALLKYGPKDLKAIAAHVGTRNMTQCRTHSQKLYMRLLRDAQRVESLRAPSVTDDFSSAASDVGSEIRSQTPLRRPAKEVYSVSPSCGITLLSIVGDELTRAMSAEE